MYYDPIVEEIQRVRQEYAKKFNYDIDAIVEDIRKKEQQHKDRLVSYPPKRPETRQTA